MLTKRNWNSSKMAKSIQSVLSLSLFVFCLAHAIPRISDETIISSFDDTLSDTTDSQLTIYDSSSPVSRQNQMPSQILSKCLCVPYYRCDPGHWEKTELDQCTRFMYVCCYGSEAVEYAMDQEWFWLKALTCQNRVWTIYFHVCLDCKRKNQFWTKIHDNLKKIWFLFISDETFVRNK